MTEKWTEMFCLQKEIADDADIFSLSERRRECVHFPAPAGRERPMTADGRAYATVCVGVCFCVVLTVCLGIQTKSIEGNFAAAHFQAFVFPPAVTPDAEAPAAAT